MKKIASFLLMICTVFLLQSCDEEIIPIVTPLPNNNIESFERLFDDTKVKTIHIKISLDKWEELDQAMINYYNQFGHYRTDYMVEADLEYTDDKGKVEVDRIGFRTRGNLSRGRIQNDQGIPQVQNFKVSFHEDYNPEYTKRTVFELEEIDLKSNRNSDSTYLTEKYSLDLFSSFGVYAAQTTLAKFKVSIGSNTYDYGVYTVFEPIDDNFIKRRLPKEETSGNLYKVLWQDFGPANLGYPVTHMAIGIKNEAINYRPSYDLKTNKKTEDHTNLYQFIKNINQLEGDAFYMYIEEHFEVDMFLRYLAVGVVLGNPDDYRAMGNNYYLYQNSLTNKWVIIPYDYDHGMGQGWEPFPNWSIGMNIYTWMNLNAQMLNQPNYPHVLVDKLLNKETYQLTYESYLKDLVGNENSLFSTKSFLSIYDDQRLLYDDLIDGSMQDFHFGLRKVENYINQKRLDIFSQLNYYESFPQQRGY